MNNAPPEGIPGGAFPSARFPLQQRLPQQPLKHLDENDGDDEREIEHADRWDHSPQRRDDGIGHFRQHARDRPLPSGIKPRQERPADEREGQELQKCQQNAEDGFRHKIAVLIVPA